MRARRKYMPVLALAALVVTTLSAPAIKRTPPTTDGLVWCPFGLLMPWFCVDLADPPKPEPKPCPVPREPKPWEGPV